MPRGYFFRAVFVQLNSWIHPAFAPGLGVHRRSHLIPMAVGTGGDGCLEI